MTRVGIFGWGIVAPRSRDIPTFARNLEEATSWLAPFNGFGRDNFLVGAPAFRLEDYRPWIEERFPPNKFHQLESKMDTNALFAIGAFIQAVEQNPGMEAELQGLGSEAQVHVATGMGPIPILYEASLDYHYAQDRWNAFWVRRERNPALAAWQDQGQEPEALEGVSGAEGPLPPDPATLPEPDQPLARVRWNAWWAPRSPDLRRYLGHLADIDALAVESGAVQSAKLNLLREKQRRRMRLQKEWGAPDPPWEAVTPNVLWNIGNTPAAQISMLGKITGLAYGPAAACSTFSVALKSGMDTIRRGEAKAVVIGACDSAPHPMVVGTFYNARVMVADGGVSMPLSGLKGTHASGGACIWIVGDYDYFTAKGYKPVGMEPLSVGVSSDADHIITPSREGPTESILQALREAGVEPAEVGGWDLHATGTPGDHTEIETLRGVVPETVLVTARKGTFGHGMAVAGGWELTAQYLGYERGEVFPTPLAQGELNPEIARLHGRFVFDTGCKAPEGVAGKLSMGVGGVNACVVSRPYDGGPQGGSD